MRYRFGYYAAPGDDIPMAPENPIDDGIIIPVTPENKDEKSE